MVIVVLFLLVIGFYLLSYPLVSISSMGLIVVGVFIGANGMQEINNLLTQGLAIIILSIGLYIFLNAQLEKIQEVRI